MEEAVDGLEGSREARLVLLLECGDLGDWMARDDGDLSAVALGLGDSILAVFCDGEDGDEVGCVGDSGICSRQPSERARALTTSCRTNTGDDRAALCKMPCGRW